MVKSFAASKDGEYEGVEFPIKLIVLYGTLQNKKRSLEIGADDRLLPQVQT